MHPKHARSCRGEDGWLGLEPGPLNSRAKKVISKGLLGAREEGHMAGRPLAWINRRVPSTIGAILLAVMFTVGALFEHAQDRILRDRGISTQAVVVKEGSGRYSSTWVRFETPNEGMVEVELRNDVGPTELGALVPVVFDPENPSVNADARGLGSPSFVLVMAWLMAFFCLMLAGLTASGVVDWERMARRR